jgi:hypothetical protein
MKQKILWIYICTSAFAFLLVWFWSLSADAAVDNYARCSDEDCGSSSIPTGLAILLGVAFCGLVAYKIYQSIAILKHGTYSEKQEVKGIYLSLALSVATGLVASVFVYSVFSAAIGLVSFFIWSVILEKRA